MDYEDALDAMGVGGYQKLLMVVCGLANATDAIEILSLSYVIPEIETEIAAWSLGALSSAVFAGMLIGALVGGFLSDVIGRRPVLMCSMLLNAIFTALFALAAGEYVMVVLRFFTGFGVGASVPVVFAYPAEVVPSANRGMAITVVALSWMIGSIVVAGLAWAIIPSYGWRLFAFACSLPALACSICLMTVIKESPRFLLVKGKTNEASKAVSHICRFNSASFGSNETQVVRIKALSLDHGNEKLWFRVRQLWQHRLRTRSFLLALVWIGICFGWYGLATWIPTMLKEKNVALCWGEASTRSCLYQTAVLVALSNLPGNILSLLLVDVIGRNTLLSVSMFLSALSAIGAWLSKDGVATGIFFCIFNGVSVVGWNILDILSTEMFPTALRGVAMGLLSSLGRISAAVRSLSVLSCRSHSPAGCSAAVQHGVF
ncbi:hypothetical protein GUITHDRAFT_62632 [Guillardia theta CCMP2712]|uniref:Major facilitator superfamily (MFS) profile domain-containing protein n=1 Tax=Guillardia theta (strain CCMP2712) TaxID=905079 RepID=L1K3W9_GUITC|nr:hypothetical protein GUITHDRAFT_62632 [Guillardia theta CCMP2712]EKX55521.1 hypothetical protein GUITHDRAFT_62632 [Guillardia theta CCMP2712]|eukprot:XP_005842501.1 hypothetical protein GUITHDRAFT_62632 [Guillardia theta CCMP2712]